MDISQRMLKKFMDLKKEDMQRVGAAEKQVKIKAGMTPILNRECHIKKIV